MKTVLIGVGQAGGKITTAISEFDAQMGFGSVLDALAINSATVDLDPLSIDTKLIGQSEVNGHGVGGDNEVGAAIMETDLGEVISNLNNRISTEAESITIIAGLGGGTGSGGAPVLARRLSEIYQVPIYVLGVLPGKDEATLAKTNAGRSLKTLVGTADATILIDNDVWKSSTESLSDGYDTINQEIAQRFGLLLAAGEATDGVGESVVDSSEVINTLRGGGMAAFGYHRLSAADHPTDNINTIMTATRSALRSSLSLSGEVTGEKALLVVAGDADLISRKGVEKSRRWVEAETGSMQVRGGDFPLQSEDLASLVLVGGIDSSERVEQLLTRAKEAAAEPTESQDTDKLFQNADLDGLL